MIRVNIEIEAEEGITYKTQFIGVRKGSQNSEVFETIEGTKASFRLSNDMLFVRAKIISSRLQENPFQKGDFESAWTQPIVN